MHAILRRQPLILTCTMLLVLASIGICDEPTITVVGDAEIRVVPDQVAITVGVESRAKTVAAATDDNDAKIRGILDFLRKSGIDDKDIRTEYISIDPIIRNTSPYSSKGGRQQTNAQPNENSDPFGSDSAQIPEQPNGFLASRKIAITIIDLKMFETIYKGLIERGTNRIRGIEYRTSELRKHRDAARLDAVRTAREKAQAMSSELGATLASIKTIHETKSGTGYGGYMMRDSRSDPFADSPSNDATSFSAGQLSITASVEIVFILGDANIKK